MLIPPPEPLLRSIIEATLREDLPGLETQNDATCRLLIPAAQRARMQLNARQPLLACGLFIPHMVFQRLGGAVAVEAIAAEGQLLAAGTPLCVLHGEARTMLAGERAALNLMQRACAVATLTRRYVDTVAGTGVIILDTRKTMPGLRVIDKYAVRAGGGQNHRLGLHDMVLIKDNHIALAGSVLRAVQAARAGNSLPVVVECDTLLQLDEALQAQPERILLDNMSPDMLRQAVALTKGRVKLEASGGITLETVRAVAETGVDYISVGALTHSAPCVDIGADIELQ